MKTTVKPISYFLLGIVAGAAFIGGMAFKNVMAPDEMTELKPDGRLQYKWYAPELPRSLSFAGEKVPMDQWEVREGFDREFLTNYYMHGSTLYILKLTTRYFPMIEARLKANGIPDDFKYLCIAESSLQNQTSRAGAVGFWQFMPGTAPSYGLEINDEIDERYNVAKATDAACTYFQQAYAKFGSWTAAAASYNCGMGGYNNQATYQQTTDYYNLQLPDETMRYVYRILALKYLVGGAKTMGYILQSQDEYRPLRTRKVTLTESIPSLAQYALDNGTSYRMLKLLNPWLRARTLTVKAGKSYELQLPL